MSKVQDNGVLHVSAIPAAPGSQLIILRAGSWCKTGEGRIYIHDSYVGGFDSQISLNTGTQEVEVAFKNFRFKLSVRVGKEGLTIQQAEYENTECNPLDNPAKTHAEVQNWLHALPRIYPLGATAVIEVPQPPPVHSTCQFIMAIPSSKTLVVHSVPSGADIFVNEEEISKTNATLKIMSYDSCLLLVRKAGYKDFAQKIDFHSKPEMTVEINLATIK